MDVLDFGRLILGASVLVTACGGASADGDGDGGGSSNQTSPDMSSSGEPTTAVPTQSDSQGTADGTMGGGGSADGTGTTNTTNTTNTTMEETSETTDMSEPGCGGIDFLFVVDNSGSMAARQDQLLASFPGFISAIGASLEGLTDNYHVGVITTDDYEFNEMGCQSLGDLVTQTGGDDSLGQVCTPFVEGNRFATEMDDLSAAFPCMAQVGTGGAFVERPITGAIAALDPANNQGGGCNAGFLRDNSILVLVVVTDDAPFIVDQDDAHPDADTSGWYDAILAAKNDDPEAVVVIGFVPWDDTSCVFMGLESPNMIDFVQSFGEQGVLGSICDADYGSTFAEAIATIVTTCEDFEEPA
ncbi:MAG: vWA domain-containing protein [Myxococcota bacterium]